MVARASKPILTLIDALEVKIKGGDVKPKYLDGLQDQLNDGSLVNDDPRHHQYAFELQALIYRTEGKRDEAAKCIGAAVEQAGSPQRLYSHLLRSDIGRDPSLAGTSDVEEVQKVHTVLGDLSLLTEGEQAFLERYGLEKMPEIDFLVRSLPVFALMFVLSGGLYGTYWFYKNWQAIRDAADVRMSPLWRTILSLFYIWPLFKVMMLIAKGRGFTSRHSSGTLATGYISTALVGVMVELSFESSWVLSLLLQLATSFMYVFFLTRIQQAAAFATSKQSTSSESRPVNYVELLFVVAGLLFLVVSFSNDRTSTIRSSGSVSHQLQSHNTKH